MFHIRTWLVSLTVIHTWHWMCPVYYKAFYHCIDGVIELSFLIDIKLVNYSIFLIMYQQHLMFIYFISLTDTENTILFFFERSYLYYFVKVCNKVDKLLNELFFSVPCRRKKSLFLLKYFCCDEVSHTNVTQIALPYYILWLKCYFQ